MKRRYEVWFLRCGLADGSGAWWFRYLLMNLGRNRCGSDAFVMPAQVWATRFPRAEPPRTFIKGYRADALELSDRGQVPFHWRVPECGIEEGACWGDMRVDGHAITWKLRYASDFSATLSHKGWIGFSRTPHSNAVFHGEVIFDGERLAGEPLGFGLQGHNCGYRHRTYWRWMHAYLSDARGRTSTIEALVYDMPLGLAFRKAVCWLEGTPITLRRIEETEIVNDSTKLKWTFTGMAPDGSRVEVAAQAAAPEIHHLPYMKTNCSGTFPVANASLARAQLRFGRNGNELLETATGAVLEMGGS